MATKRETALGALRRIKSLHPDFFDQILDSMAAEGLIEPGNGGGAIRAGAAATKIADKILAAQHDRTRSPALQFAQGQLRQLGLSSFDQIMDADETTVDLEKLDRILAASDRPNLFKINLKNSLHRCGLLVA